MNNTEYWAAKERRLLASSGIPKRYWEMKFDGLTVTKKNERAIDQVLAYLEKDSVIESFRNGIGLWITGAPGSGKTTLLSLAAIDCLRHGANTWFTKMADWQDELHAQYRTGILSEEEALQNHRRLHRVKERKLVVLDDVGKEYSGAGTGHIEGALEALLRARFDKSKPTFISTNLTPVEWAQRYGESMDSFVHEAFVRISLTGVDWRREVSA